MSEEMAFCRQTVHPIPPVYNSESRILILGSFPSVVSRETGFYYGHPRNRFWSVLAALFNEPIPRTRPEKTDLLLRKHIALWDVIRSCSISGSADSSIKDVTPNDLSVILNAADIRSIYVNGQTAFRYYRRFALPSVDRPVTCLPSTSPANAAWNLGRLTEAWRCICREGL